jgi:hypothetical protein
MDSFPEQEGTSMHPKLESCQLSEIGERQLLAQNCRFIWATSSSLNIWDLIYNGNNIRSSRRF